MSPDIRSVLPAIAERTAAIEGAFLSAGQGLSQGLAGFRTLTETLAALGAELDGESTAATARDLGRMATRLRRVAERMPVDAAALGRLIEGNRGLRRRFDDLVGDMRMMVIVSRSARLEAVVSPEQRVSVEDFSRTIDQQIGAVQARLDGCAAEHDKLTALLEQGARGHRAFEEAHGGRIEALAADLDAALLAVGDRRGDGLALMTQAATRARAIAASAGLALVSLQIGDTTRQRLEHVSVALERAEAVAADEPAVADLLRGLGEAQLRDTLATFAEEGAQLLDAFATLSGEVDALVAAGRATNGQGAEGGFMAAFRSRFDTARSVVAACDASRRVIESAIGGLGAMLETLDDTLQTLSRTSEELVIVAVNVGLKAARLGPEGRGLVTVAGELKRLSGQLAVQAEGLLATFEEVRQEAGRFTAGAEAEAAGAPSLATEAGAILDALGRGDAQIAGALAGVERTGRDFDATMAELTQAMSAVVAETARLAEAADRIGAACTGDGVPEAAVRAVDALMLPLYSMAQERDIHAGVVTPAGADVLPSSVGQAA